MILVTGAAGFIGAHVCNSLLRIGHNVLGIDDLSTGRLEFIDKRVLFFQGSVQDKDFIKSTLLKFNRNEFLGIVHVSGIKFAGQSIKKPMPYYESNTLGTQVILSAMEELEIKNLVFSSSCSVYGDVANNRNVSEKDFPNPISPYGRSKLFAEQIINDFTSSNDFRAVSLRYFNVIGGTPKVSFDVSRFNLLPNIFRAVDARSAVGVFGNKHETHDGTCVRDYVDVRILADAHVSCLHSLIEGREMRKSYNLGSEVGHSVLDLITSATRVTGEEIEIEVLNARPGDPSWIVSDCSHARQDLNWKHQASLEDSIATSWDAWKYYRNLGLIV